MLQDAEDKKEGDVAVTTTDAPAAAPAVTEAQPLADITNKTNVDKDDKSLKKDAAAQRPRRERGPPADGIPSKNKVMVANLPYDLSEEKVCS